MAIVSKCEKKKNIMTMSKRNYIAKENFHILNYCLEKVNTYKYLGLIISSDGKFKTCVSDRINKAKRAKNMTNLNIKIEKNYPNKIIQLLFNFEVNAEFSRHCLNVIKDIYASRSEVCELRFSSYYYYIFTLLKPAMISV